MDKIKFRAWLKREKIMVRVMEINFPEHYITAHDERGEFYSKRGLGCVIMMWFTGLKDKKGNEIYEGDIVVFKNVFSKDKFVGRVMYYSGCKPILWDGKHSIDLAETNEEDLEIIGNIYENPELLEEKNEQN